MVMMMVVVVMMVVLPVSERRTCERHQQQSCRKYSLHGSNPSMISIACGRSEITEVPREEPHGLRRLTRCARIELLDAGRVHLDYDDAPGNFPNFEPSALLF
jgi:hypothetical protein